MLKTICLIFLYDYWHNLQENCFARVAVDFGCGFAAPDLLIILSHAIASVGFLSAVDGIGVLIKWMRQHGGKKKIGNEKSAKKL
ncbi:hypothetical protein [Caldithrix abyssi]